jgi:pimeloyl-ACP methyl ester carboxylesterase
MIDEFNTKTFILDEANIFAVEYGKGPLIIMVHGWPESWYSWRHQIKPLADLGFKVLAIDVRGYGKSSKPEEVEKYDMLSLVNDILGIIKEEDAEKAILIGHDWGAPICWNTAALHPNKVKAVIGLSVPHARRGTISNSELWRTMYKDNFFYQTYFEKEGVAEEELERNIGVSLRKIYYWISAEGHDAKVKTNFEKNSELLDGLVDPNPFPSWLTEEDLNFYINEFTNSGFRGPINRYRNQDRDWENIPELSELKIEVPSFFIGGGKDSIRKFIKGYDLYENPGKHCNDFYGKIIIEKAGHWVQQEAPKETTDGIISFLKKLQEDGK